MPMPRALDRPERSSSRRRLASFEEVELAKRVARGDLEARRRMIEANLGLVEWIARTYLGRGVELEDLVQEGTLGLIRALGKFDPRNGARFSTYARWWVRQSIERAVADHGRTIRLPASAANKLRRMDQAERRLAGSLGRTPQSDEVSRAAGLDPANAAELRLAAEAPWSLDARGGRGADEPAVEDAGYADERALDRESMVRTLQRALGELPDPRQRRVLRLHYGLGGQAPRTLSEIGQTFGLTAARISQLEQSALAALRSVPAGRDLAELAHR
jgi:RNA polymerase primary sigma factor